MTRRGPSRTVEGRTAHLLYRRWLSERLDEPLAKEAEERLRRHLDTCPSCRAAARDYEAQRRLLRAAPPIPAPRDLRARTLAALDREVAREMSLLRRLGRASLPGGHASRGLVAGALTSVGLVVVVVAAQVLPYGSTSGGGRDRATPTPFPVPRQPLAFVTQDGGRLRIYRTQVDHVCPPTFADCTTLEPDRAGIVAGFPDLEAESVALGRRGDQVAIVGRGQRGEALYAVLEFTPEPARGSTKGNASGAGGGAGPSPRTGSSASSPGTGQDATGGKRSAGGAVRAPRATPTAAASSGMRVVPSTATPAPATAAPGAQPSLATLTARPILRNVIAMGATAAWSADGEVLAFSAMPADRRHGPDVYVWRPGDERARPLTRDHRSYFASWAGPRILVSRVAPLGASRKGAERRLDVTNVVIDPATREERRIEAERMWLPAVDPGGRYVIFWHGRLVDEDSAARPAAGRLYLADWTSLDPFARGRAAPGLRQEGAGRPPATSGGGPLEPGPLLGVQPLEPAERGKSIVEWDVRWSHDGSAYGLWIGEPPGSGTGLLAVYAIDAETGRVRKEALLAPTLAQRGFTIGQARVAWVAPIEKERGGELRVQAWGPAGSGEVRIRQPLLGEGSPAL